MPAHSLDARRDCFVVECCCISRSLGKEPVQPLHLVDKGLLAPQAGEQAVHSTVDSSAGSWHLLMSISQTGCESIVRSLSSDLDHTIEGLHVLRDSEKLKEEICKLLLRAMNCGWHSDYRACEDHDASSGILSTPLTLLCQIVGTPEGKDIIIK